MVSTSTQTSYSLDKLNIILKELIDLSNQDYKSFDDCLSAYIQFGIDKTGFKTGMVSQIKNEEYKILQAISWKEGFKKGVVVSLCDTLCNAAYESGETLFCAKTENTPFYGLPARSFLNIEAIICSPIKINNEVYGTLTFCSETEIVESGVWDFLTSLVELLGQSLSKIIKENILHERLEEEKKILEIGSKLIKMASYKRLIGSDEVICSDNFYKIFEIEKKIDGKLFLSDTFLDRVISTDKELVNESFQNSFTRDVLPFEYRIVKKDGSFKWLKHELKCDLEKGYVLGIVQDITDLKNSLSDLNSKNQELEQFAYIAAHDLQSPLRTISGFSTLLNSQYGTTIDDTGKTFLNYLVTASARMSDQINGLLKYSKIGRSGNIQEIDLNKLVKDTLSDLGHEIEKSQATINCCSFPMIKGYYVENRMLWQNFLSNAIKFRREAVAPKIDIKFSECDEYWCFYIEDNGIGIGKEYIDSIFNIFTKLNPVEEYDGSGIGLANCKKIIDLHDGFINVDSEEGVGTTIEFSIKK